MKASYCPLRCYKNIPQFLHFFEQKNIKQPNSHVLDDSSILLQKRTTSLLLSHVDKWNPCHHLSITNYAPCISNSQHLCIIFHFADKSFIHKCGSLVSCPYTLPCMKTCYGFYTLTVKTTNISHAFQSQKPKPYLLMVTWASYGKRIEKQKRFFLQKTYKWRGLTWRREESGTGREGRRSGEIKWGNPLRVERRRAGVSIWGQLPSWNTPVLPAELPLLVLHAFTENFMLSSPLSFASSAGFVFRQQGKLCFQSFRGTDIKFCSK